MHVPLCRLLIFFQISENSFKNTIRVSKGLGPDQDIITYQKKLVVCSLFSKFFRKYFQEHYQSVKRFGSRSGHIYLSKKNCSLLTFFKILQKILSRTLSESQTVWVQIRTYLPIKKKLVVCSLFSKFFRKFFQEHYQSYF